MVIMGFGQVYRRPQGLLEKPLRLQELGFLELQDVLPATQPTWLKHFSS